MNKDNAKDYLPLIQALAEGKQLQLWDGVERPVWTDCSGEISFMAESSFYRVKPKEPRECWIVVYDRFTVNTADVYFNKENATRALLGKGTTELIHMKEVLPP